MEIREIKSKEDQEQYQNLCKYCFVDQVGWTDIIFSGDIKNDTAYGAFEDDTLKSGVISKSITVSLFGSLHKMSGISAVASYPETRNKGYIRQLIMQALNDERKKGKIVSSLYPFSYAYYNKFGYGMLENFIHVSFRPEDIIPLKNTNALVPFDGSVKMYKEIQKVHEQYFSGFDFGSVPEEKNVNDFINDMDFMKAKVYTAYNKSGITGVVIYKLKPASHFGSELEILRMFWNDPEGIRDIMNHFAGHRGQCSSIAGDIHSSSPVHYFMKEPRIPTGIMHSWMARPLDLEKVLEAKLSEGNSFDPVVFSIKDPVIPEETATYSVTQSSVTKQTFNGENLIPLPLFSSLLFGGITPKQAFNSVYSQPWIIAAEDFFKKERKSYINERF